MKNNISKNSIAIALSTICLSTLASADISGIVYTDFNLNGTKDANDVLLKGVAVHAVCEDGSTDDTVTNANGQYTISSPSGQYCRIEADPSSQGLDSASNSAGSSPLVDRVKDGTTHNISVASSGSYCQANPDVIAVAMPTISDDGSTTYYPDGHPTLIKTAQPSVGSNNGQDTIDTSRTLLTDYDTTGSIWGLAYKKATQEPFMAASLKPYANLGTGGIGAIYKITPGGTISTFATVPNVSITILNRGGCVVRH